RILALLASSNFSRNLVRCFLTPSPHVILSGASRCLILSRRSAASISGSGRAVEESLFGVAKTARYQQSRYLQHTFQTLPPACLRLLVCRSRLLARVVQPGGYGRVLNRCASSSWAPAAPAPCSPNCWSVRDTRSGAATATSSERAGSWVRRVASKSSRRTPATSGPSYAPGAARIWSSTHRLPSTTRL